MKKSKEIVKTPVKKTKKSTLATAVAVGAALVSAVDVRLKVQHYILGAQKVGEPISIAFLSDLQSCYYGKGQKTLVNAIDKENPDVILLGGNIFDSSLSMENAEILLEQISPRYPCYYVTGNQEYLSKDVGEIFSTLRRYGVTILSGVSDLLSVKGNLIRFSGITDPEVSRVASSYPSTLEQLEQLKVDLDDDSEVFGDEEADCADGGNTVDYSILLAHRPEHIALYLEYNYDLVLSGHTNGGQWRIPFINKGFYASGQGIFPKYSGGEYSFGDKSFIVSRGLARESNRIPRLFNRPELVMIDIV